MTAKRRRTKKAVSEESYFISYSREDREFVEPIVGLLRVGTRAFLDTDSIPPGNDWQKEIQMAIRRCSVLFVFWCRHSQASEAVRSEWDLAIKYRRKIVPVMLDRTSMPETLKQLQWIDCCRIAERIHGSNIGDRRGYAFEQDDWGRPKSGRGAKSGGNVWGEKAKSGKGGFYDHLQPVYSRIARAITAAIDGWFEDC